MKQNPHCTIIGHQINCRAFKDQYTQEQKCIIEQIHFQGYTASHFIISIEEIENRLQGQIAHNQYQDYLQQIVKLVEDIQEIFKIWKQLLKRKQTSRICDKYEWNISQLIIIINSFNKIVDFSEEKLKSLQIQIKCYIEDKDYSENYLGLHNITPFYSSKDPVSLYVHLRQSLNSDKIYKIFLSANQKYMGAMCYQSKRDSPIFKIISIPKMRLLQRRIINQHCHAYFSQDSRFIILTIRNYLCVYYVKNLRLIFNFDIEDFIFDIQLMNKNVILIKSFKQIIVFDIIQKQKFLLVLQDQGCLSNVTYDSYNDLIVGIYYYNIIKLFDRKNGNLILEYQFQNTINEFQFTNKGQNLLINTSVKIIRCGVSFGRISELQSFEFGWGGELKLGKFDPKIYFIKKKKLKIFDEMFNLLYQIDVDYKSQLIQASFNFIFLNIRDSIKIYAIKKTSKFLKEVENEEPQWV